MKNGNLFWNVALSLCTVCASADCVSHIGILLPFLLSNPVAQVLKTNGQNQQLFVEKPFISSTRENQAEMDASASQYGGGALCTQGSSDRHRSQAGKPVRSIQFNIIVLIRYVYGNKCKPTPSEKCCNASVWLTFRSKLYQQFDTFNPPLFRFFFSVCVCGLFVW